MLLLLNLLALGLALLFQFSVIPELQPEIFLPINIALWAISALSALSILLKKKGVSTQITAYEKQALEQSEIQSKLRQEITEHAATIERDKKHLTEMQSRLTAHENLLSDAREDSDTKNTRLKQLEAELKIAQANDNEQSVMSVLSSLQKHGRFLDFVMGDISSLPDDRVGAAARVVHQGCQGILKQYFDFRPVFEKTEGEQVTLDKSMAPGNFRLVGGEAADLPVTAKLLHKGWRTTKVNLPQRITTDQATKDVIVPAELQL